MTRISKISCRTFRCLLCLIDNRQRQKIIEERSTRTAVWIMGRGDHIHTYIIYTDLFVCTFTSTIMYRPMYLFIHIHMHTYLHLRFLSRLNLCLSQSLPLPALFLILRHDRSRSLHGQWLRQRLLHRIEAGHLSGMRALRAHELDLELLKARSQTV